MRRLRLGLIAALALLVLAEIGARLLGFGAPLLYRAAPSGYEPVAGQTITRIGKHITINALGTRGAETTATPAPGVLRILSLGDSVANGGSRSDDSQTYEALLQADLTRAGLHAEVLNASAGGWAVPNEAAWLADHGTLGAQMLLLEVNDKDLDQAFVPASLLDTNPSFLTHRPATALSEILWRYALPRLLPSVFSAADPGSLADGSFQQAHVGPMLAAVSTIIAQAKAHGARVVIFYHDVRQGALPAMEPARAALFDLARAQEVPVIRPQLARQNDAATLFIDQIHPNTAGNRRLATAFSAALTPMLEPTQRQRRLGVAAQQ